MQVEVHLESLLSSQPEASIPPVYTNLVFILACSVLVMYFIWSRYGEEVTPYRQGLWNGRAPIVFNKKQYLKGGVRL